MNIGQPNIQFPSHRFHWCRPSREMKDGGGSSGLPPPSPAACLHEIGVQVTTAAQIVQRNFVIYTKDQL
jgi:hypothetical protein